MNNTKTIDKEVLKMEAVQKVLSIGASVGNVPMYTTPGIMTHGLAYAAMLDMAKDQPNMVRYIKKKLGRLEKMSTNYSEIDYGIKQKDYEPRKAA